MKDEVTKMTEKKCPPFCNPVTCHKQHHVLIVKLVNIDEKDESSFESFKSELKNFRASIAPEHPIPDSFREYRYPILHWASVLGKVKAVEFLIKNGYQPTIRSQEKGETALHRVVLCLHHSLQCNRQQMVIKKFKILTDLLSPALFVADDNENTPPHACAILCNQICNNALTELHRKALEIMIEKIIDMRNRGVSNQNGLNMRNRELKTVLHILAAGKSEDCIFLIKKLLENGADPEMQDKDGKSAIDIAKEKQNKQIYKEMKQKKFKRQRTESDCDNESSHAPPVQKVPKIALRHNVVTSTTTKDESDENVKNSDKIKVHLQRRTLFTPNYEVRPSLVSAGSDGAASSTIHPSQLKKEPMTDNCSESTRTNEKKLNVSSKEFGAEAKKPRLEHLLKKVNQEKLILDTVEEKRQQLENVCLDSDTKLSELRQKKHEIINKQEAISNKIKERMEELNHLREKQAEYEDNIKTLDDEVEKEEENRSKIVEDLANYEQIISCLSSVKDDE